MKVSENLWEQLVAAFAAAAAQYDEAEAAYRRAAPPDGDADVTCPEEEAWAAALEAEAAEEERLLGVVAPHPAGAALQLRIFARRHFSVDLASPQTEAEEPEAAVLRRIYSALID